MHHTIITYLDICLKFQKDWLFNYSFIRYNGYNILIKIKADNAPAYVSSKEKQIFTCHNIKHITGIPYNPTGQIIVKISNHSHSKGLLIKHEGDMKTPRDTLHKALLTLNWWILMKQGQQLPKSIEP